MPHHIRILAGKLDRRAGSHVYNYELAHRLAARGHRVSVVSFEPAVGLDGRAEVFIVSPASADRPLPLIWRFAALQRYWLCSRAIAGMDLPAPDIVIGAEHLFLKAHTARFPGVPLVYLPHSLLVESEIDSYNLTPVAHLVTRRLYLHLQRWALRHAAMTLRFTRQACEALTSRYGSAIRSPFFVNPMGVPVPAQIAGRSPGGPVRLLCVGRLVASKQVDVALTALASLTHLDWRFDIVGDGESRPALRRQAADLGLLDRVTFHGFQAQPERWYLQADLLVFPSRLENSPVTMLEAMSYGVPCLAMRADGVQFKNANAEIITDRTDGFLASTYDDFARMLAELLTDRPALEAAREAARQTILSRHTWDQHLDRYEQLFADLTGSR